MLAETTPVWEAAGLQQDLRRPASTLAGSSIQLAAASRLPVPGYPCRRELPLIDDVAGHYAQRIADATAGG